METECSFSGQRLQKRVIAPWLAGNSLKTKGTVRLPLGGLGTVGTTLCFLYSADLDVNAPRPMENLEALPMRIALPLLAQKLLIAYIKNRFGERRGRT